MKKIIILVLILISILSCKESNKNESKSNDLTEKEYKITDENNLKVYIDQNGVIYSDGEQSNLKALDESLSVLKKSNGTVFYSRAETYEGDKMIEVMNIVTKHQLPIAFYTDQTFTERVEF